MNKESSNRGWRGIVLSGGSGTRLYPLTYSVSKQLLPLYDKPMVYYAVSTLMEAGIREIAVITATDQKPLFEKLLGDGSQWGCRFEYFVQEKPEGLAQSFLICEEFIRNFNTALILGDNFFYGQGLNHLLKQAMEQSQGATVFAYHVKDPQRYGVVNFNEKADVLEIVEKPRTPKSSYAVTGLYFYDSEVVEFAKQLKPSKRGELEITDINNLYLFHGKLKVRKLEQGIAWLDTGTCESLLEAASFIHAVQSRQGLMVGCPEEIALNNGFITREEFVKLADIAAKNAYGDYLRRIAGISSDD